MAYPGYPDYGMVCPPYQWWEHSPQPVFPGFDWTLPHHIPPTMNLQVVSNLIDNIVKLCSIDANLGQELGDEVKANVKRLNDWLTKELSAVGDEKKDTGT